jgi:hypothetical protein
MARIESLVSASATCRRKRRVSDGNDAKFGIHAPAPGVVDDALSGEKGGWGTVVEAMARSAPTFPSA